MLRQMVADATTATVTVKDLLGRNVFNEDVQFANSTTQLQLTSLPTGVYMLQIMEGSRKVSNFKFVIQK